MTIYQVIDDLNRPMYESADVDKANSEAELLNLYRTLLLRGRN